MIIDCHTHFNHLETHQKMLDDQARTGSGQFIILVYEKLTSDCDSLKMPHGLWFKHKHPDRVYTFGGLDMTGLSPGGGKPEIDLAQQIHEMIEMGCDGLKLLTGKPTQRKLMGTPLDSPLFDPMYDLLEKTGFPVLWHVADPPEFWFPDQVPLWAKMNKWWYDDTHPSKEQIDAEIAGVFRKHPELNLILPHFFFLSQDLEQAGRLLKQYPNFCFDLAPGVEMLHNFTRRHDQARNFFIEHADRILFGTDIGIGRHETGPKRGWMIRNFLETDDKFQVPDDPFMTPDPRPDLHGIKLPKDALEKIYCGNIQRVLKAKTPRKLNLPLVKKMLQTWEERSIRRGEGSTTAKRVLQEIA